MEDGTHMKRTLCLLLSLLLMLTMLTSCDINEYVTNIENLIADGIGQDTESTTYPNTETTPKLEVTTPEVTTPELEITTPEPEITPPQSQINYGTLNYPVSPTYAHSVCANLANDESSAEPFYIKGKVTEIGEAGKYYKNV